MLKKKTLQRSICNQHPFLRIWNPIIILIKKNPHKMDPSKARFVEFDI